MTNPLYPAFFRLDCLQLLVVGAGEVGEEKLSFILKSSPNANVIIVAPEMGEDLRKLLEGYQYRTYEKSIAGPQVQGALNEASSFMTDDGTGQFDVAKLRAAGDVQIHDTYYVLGGSNALGGLYLTPEGGSVMYLKRVFHPEDVKSADLVIAATDLREVNQSVYDAAKQERRLCNIADTPSLCDFYLGSIVTRGPLKIAISTNGQSPTFAKRFRQFLEAELPDFETSNLLDNLKLFRGRLSGDFQAKVRQLNAVTNSLLSSTEGRQAGCRCPEGDCLVEAAAGENTPVPDE